MAYNGYGGYYNSYPQFNSSMGYQQYQNPIMQQQVMSGQQQGNDIPFSEMHFGTLKEAEAYIVPPMKSVVFYNTALGEIYVKSADNMGKPVLETFKKVVAENESEKPVSAVLDTKDFVKREDLKDFLTKNELKDVLTIENTKDFVTKQDIQSINNKLEDLSKQVRINAILKGDTNNG